MKTNIIRSKRVFVALFALSAFFVGGCNTTTEVTDAAPIVIKQGMLASDLVSLLGEPEGVEPYGDEGSLAELWVYKEEDVDTKMVATELKERIYIDPLSGAERTVYESIMSPETKVFEKKTVFLIVEGKVSAWKVQNEERSYIQ